MSELIPAKQIERSIFIIRGQKVMLDRDLAKIYGVSTMRLNEQVKRNQRRFPQDFMFRLTKQEMKNWISQNAISNSSIKMGLRKQPSVFTEHGAVMLAAILNSNIAIEASIQIVRAFNRLRQMALTHQELTEALSKLKRKISKHDKQFDIVFHTLHRLMNPPEKLRPTIGFIRPERS